MKQKFSLYYLFLTLVVWSKVQEVIIENHKLKIVFEESYKK